MDEDVKEQLEIDMTSQCIRVTMFLKRPGNDSGTRLVVLRRTYLIYIEIFDATACFL